jgi:hypothetical protein
MKNLYTHSLGSRTGTDAAGAHTSLRPSAAKKTKAAAGNMPTIQPGTMMHAVEVGSSGEVEQDHGSETARRTRAS